MHPHVPTRGDDAVVAVKAVLLMLAILMLIALSAARSALVGRTPGQDHVSSQHHCSTPAAAGCARASG